MISCADDVEVIIHSASGQIFCRCREKFIGAILPDLGNVLLAAVYLLLDAFTAIKVGPEWLAHGSNVRYIMDVRSRIPEVCRRIPDPQ